MFWPSLLLIAIAFGVAFLAGGFAEQWQNWAVAAVGASLAVGCWLIPLLRWLSRRYIITTRRVVVRGGLIVAQDVWNDSAERLLDRSLPDRAP